MISTSGHHRSVARGISRYIHFFQKHIDLEFTHDSLSVSRISFFSIAFLEILQLYLWRDFAMRGSAGWVGNIAIPVDLIVMLMIIAGWKTRFFCISNYVLTRIIQSNVEYHYHFDHVIESLSFIFMFLPAPRTLSVDSWIRRSSENKKLPGWSVLLLFLGIELIYFDSLFYKYQSELWMGGFAFWLPSAIPHFSTHVFPDWMENKWFLQGLSYTSLFLETFFPFILFRRTRLIFCWIALALHLGITIFFPIPFFGLGLCGLLLFFFHWNFHQRPQAAPVSTESRSYPIAAYGLCLLLLFSQAGLVLRRSYSFADSPLKSILSWNGDQLSKWMGLYDHGVYIDHHFLNHIPILRYKAVVNGMSLDVPSFGEKGYPDYPAVTGRIFVSHLFWIRNEISRPVPKFNTITKYLNAFSKRKGISPSQYDMFYKDTRLTMDWDFMMDDEIENRPWKFAGRINVNPDRSFTFVWDDKFVSLMHWSRQTLNVNTQ